MKKQNVKLRDIHITREFKNTKPSPVKLLKCMTHYAKTGKLDRDIILTEDNVLVDGYVGYLTLLSLGIKKYKCIKVNDYQWYIAGNHLGNRKVYYWKAPKEIFTDGIPYIQYGVVHRIQTTNGLDWIKIKKVFLSNKPPFDGEIKEFTFA